MNRPDAPADATGFRYEHWWTLAECLRLLHGATETLRVEALGAGRAELIVTADTCREWHRVRAAHPNGVWSLAALDSSDDGLLQSAGNGSAGNDDRWVFVSGSAAPELTDLCAAARDANETQALQRDWLTSRIRREALARLRRCWACEVPAVFDRLQRIDVRTPGEMELEERVGWGLKALFVADANRVRAELLEILRASLQRTLTRRQLVERLARRGSRPRRLRDPDRAAEAVAAATDRYLDGARRHLFRGTLVPRQAAARLEARLQGPASESVLTGPAGAGKTGCVIGVVDALREHGVPVLAFRIDHMLLATTTADLGRRLDLEESPVLVLAEAARATGGSGVLIVDQLDAASNLAGPDSDACALVERLMHEMRGTCAPATLHTVVVCRAFDWRNDPRLRRLEPAGAVRIEVEVLARDEVERVLDDAGFDPTSFRARQLEILRLPQHLALFLDSDAESVASTDVRRRNRPLRPLLDREAPGSGTAGRAAAGRVDGGDEGPLRRDELHATAHRAARERLDDVSPRLPPASGGRGRRHRPRPALRVRARHPVRLLRRPGMVQPARIARIVADQLRAASVPARPRPSDAGLPPGTRTRRCTSGNWAPCSPTRASGPT